MLVNVRGCDSYAYTGSRAFDPALPTIVFVHGAANDHGVWALQSRYFAHHGHNVLAVDLPGHGRSGGEALPSVAAIADWLVAFLDAMRVERAILVGHSMGALVALDMTGKHPGRVAKLALLGAAVPMPVSEMLLDAAKQNDHVAFELINGWSFSAKRLLGGNPWPGMWMTGQAMRLMERVRPNVLYADLVACREYTNGLRAAAGVWCSSLMLLGARDVMTPAKAARDLTATLRDVSVVTLDCGHSMMSEQPDALLDALRRFLL